MFYELYGKVLRTYERQAVHASFKISVSQTDTVTFTLIVVVTVTLLLLYLFCSFHFQMQNILQERNLKVDSSPLAMYNLFIERVRVNLHVVLCMSPIGDAFRNRLRMFPSLINCCTIDWFQVRKSTNKALRARNNKLSE